MQGRSLIRQDARGVSPACAMYFGCKQHRQDAVSAHVPGCWRCTSFTMEAMAASSSEAIWQGAPHSVARTNHLDCAASASECG